MINPYIELINRLDKETLELTTTYKKTSSQIATIKKTVPFSLSLTRSSSIRLVTQTAKIKVTPLGNEPFFSGITFTDISSVIGRTVVSDESKDLDGKSIIYSFAMSSDLQSDFDIIDSGGTITFDYVANIVCTSNFIVSVTYED